MTDAPDRIWILPTHGAREPDDYFLLHPDYRNGRGSEYIRRDTAVLAALPEVQALIAAAYEAAATCTEWTAWGQRHNLTEASRRAIRALTHADATAALAARDAAMIARGMREAAGIDWASGRDVSDTAPNYLSDWQRGLVAGQNAMRDAILARAAEIEMDAK